MKYLILFFACAGSLLALSYRMEVTLDIGKKTVGGREIIVWSNNQNVLVHFIPFHLYMNAFSGDDSMFFRESGGRHRQFSAKTDDPKAYGYCRLRSLKVNDREALASFYYMSELKNPERFKLFWPDEISLLSKPDDTIGVLQLASPVIPGQEVTIEIEFETKFPKVFARAGYYKDFFMGGQWFPKIAVFEGEKGWNCHFYHNNSEFFSDFANFDVTIHTPQQHIIGATGKMVSQTTRDGSKETRFIAHNVGDFAFTAWDKFCVALDKWKEVELILLHQPGNESTVRRQFRALKAAFDACAHLTGFDYPYPCFTLVDPPFRAMGAGGMEYPMLVTGGVFSPFIPENIPEFDMVIVHEFIHNYFYGIVASNEFEHAWMDEGLTSYVTGYALEKFLFPQVKNPPLSISAWDFDAISNSLYKGAEYPAKAAWQFYAGYSSQSYCKPSVYLKTLENLIGEKKMVELFTTYFNRFRFKHPRPEDFFQAVREVAGQNHLDFIVKAFTSKAKIDYAIFSARSRNVADVTRIYFDRQKNSMQKTTATGEKSQPFYENTVIAGNLGDFALPVEIEAQMEDGQKKIFTWDGRNEWIKFEWTSPSKLRTATIDPKRNFVCDASPQNNERSLKPQTNGLFRRIAAGLALAVEFVFAYAAFFL